MLRTWTPETGFQATDLEFTPADIIFGARIASIIRNTPQHATHSGEITMKVRREATDETFESWFLAISLPRLRDVIEFSFFRQPPQ